MDMHNPSRRIPFQEEYLQAWLALAAGGALPSVVAWMFAGGDAVDTVVDCVDPNENYCVMVGEFDFHRTFEMRRWEVTSLFWTQSFVTLCARCSVVDYFFSA